MLSCFICVLRVNEWFGNGGLDSTIGCCSESTISSAQLWDGNRISTQNAHHFTFLWNAIPVIHIGEMSVSRLGTYQSIIMRMLIVKQCSWRFLKWPERCNPAKLKPVKRSALQDRVQCVFCDIFWRALEITRMHGDCKFAYFAYVFA